MAGSVRPWAAHPEAVDDRDRYAEMTTAERLECFAEVCELARTIPKDLADIGRPLQIQRGRIDPTFVRQSLVDMLGADDERIAASDELVRHNG